MTEKQIEICEGLGWKVMDCGDTTELENHSPAGEDIIVTLDNDNIPEDALGEYDSFDEEDHVRMWLNAKERVSGVPDMKTLVEDAAAIKEMLRQLAEALEEAA